MKEKIAVLFPGQGSQFVGMGKEFLESSAAAAELMALAEKVSSFPLRHLCLSGPLEELTRTLYLQPAITALNLVCWQELVRAGVQPDYVAGHSLGEYSALFAAGVLSAADTMKLVTERGKLMEREAGKHPGSMRALLGLTLAEVEALLAEAAPAGVVTAANHNSEKQIVISGEVAALDRASALAEEKGGRAIPLPVSGAWHSSLVQEAVPDFTKVMQQVPFLPPAIPLLFNVTAAEEQQPEEIRNIMARQIASMVRWYDIINTLVRRDVTIFIEVGPKTVLSGLLKKIIPRDFPCRVFQLDTPEKLQSCLAAI